MRGNAVRKLYPKVRGAERFRLLALAYARGDLAEVEHLIGTAPRVTAVSRDLEFVEASRRFVHLQGRFDRAIAPLLAWLVLVDLIEPVANNLIAHAEDPEARIYADILRGYLEAARRHALSKIKTLEQVLDELCREQLGMDGKAVLAVPMPGSAWMLSRYRRAIDASEVDPDDRVALRAELELSWPPEGADAVS